MCHIPHRQLLRKMKFWQLNAAMRGLHRQGRVSWETMRMLIFTLQKMVSKEGEGPNSFSDIVKFPWERTDDISEDEEENEEKMMALIQSCREHNAMIEKVNPRP